jgi:hypothetical protein
MWFSLEFNYVEGCAVAFCNLELTDATAGMLTCGTNRDLAEFSSI